MRWRSVEVSLAFVVDGLIPDLAEVRQMGIPVFARGVIPIAGPSRPLRPLGGRVRRGGVNVTGGDVVVADEEGMLVIPRPRQEHVLHDAKAKLAKEARESLDAWEQAHRARVEAILREHGFKR